MRRAIHSIPVFVFAFLATACSSGMSWGAAGAPPSAQGDWRADMPAMLADAGVIAELERSDAEAKKKFLDYLRSVRLDIRGSRLRGGTRRKPGKWVSFRVLRSGRDYLVIRYRVRRDYSPAVVRLDFRGANRLRFREIDNKDARPLYFKR